MKTIKIQITKAKIRSVAIYYEQKMPRIIASVDLLTDGDEKISEYSLDTANTWDKNRKFDVPISMIQPINEICLQLEEIVTENLNNRVALLPDKEIK